MRSAQSHGWNVMPAGSDAGHCRTHSVTCGRAERPCLQRTPNQPMQQQPRCSLVPLTDASINHHCPAPLLMAIPPQDGVPQLATRPPPASASLRPPAEPTAAHRGATHHGVPSAVCAHSNPLMAYDAANHVSALAAAMDAFSAASIAEKIAAVTSVESSGRGKCSTGAGSAGGSSSVAAAGKPSGSAPDRASDGGGGGGGFGRPNMKDDHERPLVWLSWWWWWWPWERDAWRSELPCHGCRSWLPHGPCR